MGEHARYALQSVAIAEGLRDDYVQGRLDPEEAYEYGILDEMGVELEGTQEAWDRSKIQTVEVLAEQRKEALLILELSDYEQQSAPVPLPSCPACSTTMGKRLGKFGAFYYCPAICKGRVTISERTWISSHSQTKRR